MARLTPDTLTQLRAEHAAGVSIRALAARFNVAPSTVSRALKGRIPDAVRTESDLAPYRGLRAPRRDWSAYAWTLDEIRAARNDQRAGNFKRSVRLAEAMRTDDALYTAFHNRLAPQVAIQAQLEPAAGTRGKAVMRKALGSAIATRECLAGVLGTLADHGIAVGYIDREPNDAGTRVDMRLTEWPLEHISWNNSREKLEARVDGGLTVDVVHGDGEWVVFRKFEQTPWAKEAAVLPGALVYAAHAFGLRDWAQSSLSHGLAKLIGELPAGIALAQKDGTLSPEAMAFLDMLQDVVNGDSPVGIRPHGSKTDFEANNSTAWQVFKELIDNREKAAARIYLGTDAYLGSTGSAPGVDIATLFGVSTTKIQGDFHAIETALNTGFYPIWTAVNEGDTSRSPSLRYLMPDPDESTKAEQYSKRQAAFFDAVERYRELGFDLTQEVLNELAARYSVDPPRLANISAPAFTPAPTDAAKVMRVREVRSTLQQPPLGDARDEMLMPEFEASLTQPKPAPATAVP